MKLSLAAALCHGADLLILDEPTSGLDPIAREDILEIFRDYAADGKKASLLSSYLTLTGKQEPLLTIGNVGIFVLLMLLSYRISVRIFEKKEL